MAPMDFIKNLGNWTLLVVLAGALVVLLGVWARAMTYLFCFGYGC